MNEEQFAELSAGYALHALSPDDLAAFEAARAEHPEWEHHVTTDAATAASLADGAAEVPPPLTLRSTLLAKVAADAAAEDTAEQPPPARPEYVEPAPTTNTIQTVARRNWTRGLLALAASLVLLVALGYGAVAINDYLNRPAAVVALSEIEAAPDAQEASGELADGGTVTAYWSESLGKAVITSSALPAVGEGETYEMWFVRGDAPVSAGLFEPSTGDATTALLEGPVEPGDVIAVTVEPAGGSPTGAPTSDPIVAIPTA